MTCATMSLARPMMSTCAPRRVFSTLIAVSPWRRGETEWFLCRPSQETPWWRNRPCTFPWAGHHTLASIMPPRGRDNLGVLLPERFSHSLRFRKNKKKWTKTVFKRKRTECVIRGGNVAISAGPTIFVHISKTLEKTCSLLNQQKVIQKLSKPQLCGCSSAEHSTYVLDWRNELKKMMMKWVERRGCWSWIGF